jgi:hypothetical protein
LRGYESGRNDTSVPFGFLTLVKIRHPTEERQGGEKQIVLADNLPDKRAHYECALVKFWGASQINSECQTDGQTDIALNSSRKLVREQIASKTHGLAARTSKGRTY